MTKVVWLMIFVFVPVLIAHAEINPADIAGIWLFDEGSGEVAADSSGNGHDGQIGNGEWAAGKFGKAIKFVEDGEVTVESAERLHPSDAFTMMAYINPSELTGPHQVIAKNGEYLLRIDTPGEGGKISTFVNLGGWEPRASAGVPEVNTWAHLAAVYDGAAKELRIYVNGALIGQSARDGDNTPTDDPLTFGTWNEGNRFRGMLDEIAIFNAVLTEEDIMDIAQNGLSILLDTGTSVQPSGKLSTTWGNLKGL